MGTRVLAHWYSHQQSFIRWQNATSECFNIGNGVRQEWLLSSFLFSFYIRSLIKELVASQTGCYIGQTCFNILAYADDIVLLSPSWLGLQSLLNVISQRWRPPCQNRMKYPFIFIMRTAICYKNNNNKITIQYIKPQLLSFCRSYL